MRTKIAVLAMVAGLFAGEAKTQCPAGAPASFANNTSNTGAVLNINTPADSSNNSLFTPAAQDNTATATGGQALTFTLANTAGAAAQPLAILFTAGGPTGPIPLPSGDNVYLNLAGPIGAVIDGIGITGPPNNFATHPGPSFLFVLGTNLSTNPALSGTCTTFQSAIVDPTAVLSLRISNAVRLQIRAGITNITPNFAAEGQTVAVANTGSGSGTTHFPAYNANGLLGPSDLPVGPLAGTSFTVPFGAGSGALGYEDVASAGNISNQNADDVGDYLAIVSPSGVTTQAAGPITLVASPFSTSEKWASIRATLASAAATDTYTVPLAAGDIIRVEVYSLNQAQTRILNGFGKTFNPNATEGFDPLVNLQTSTNTMPLTFNAGTNILVHGDDDGGPGFNSALTFQVVQPDVFRILIGTGFPNAFVTGDYLLNVRVTTAQPVIQSFTISGTTTANIAAAGTALTIVGANFISGAAYNVTLTPVHGFYAPVTIAATAASATQIPITLPALAAGPPPTFAVGSHYVNARHVFSGATTLRWNTTFAAFLSGTSPDLLVVSAPAFTVQTTATIAVTPNTTTIQQVNATANFGGFLTFAATAGQRVYIEALGVDSGSMSRRVDSQTNFSAAAGAVFNPHLTLFAPGFVPIIAQNDDNGLFPVAYPWPNNGAVGIGRGAAILTTASAGAGTYLVYYVQNILFGNAPYECQVNIVVM